MSRPSVAVVLRAHPRRAVIGRTVRFGCFTSGGGTCPGTSGTTNGRRRRRRAACASKTRPAAPASPRSPSARPVSRPNVASGRPRSRPRRTPSGRVRAASGSSSGRAPRSGSSPSSPSATRSPSPTKTCPRAASTTAAWWSTTPTASPPPRRAAATTAAAAFYPIFIGAGGAQYHYNYGGSGSVGQPVSGGTTTVPRDSTKVTTVVRQECVGQQGHAGRPRVVLERIEQRKLMERHRGSRGRAGRRSSRAGDGLRHPGPRPGRRRAPVLGRVGALRVRDGRGALPRSRRRGRALDVPGGRRARRHHGAVPRLRAPRVEPGRASRRRGGAAIRTSTAASTCATTAAARPSCWSTTPTPPPRCWRRRSCSGTGCRTSTPTTTSGTRCTRSSSSGGARSARGCPATTCYFTWSRGDSTGEDHVTVGYLQETAAEAGLDTDRAGDRGRRLGLVA